MSSRRRSVLGPINEVPKIDIRQPTKRNTRRASMAVTSSYTTNKPNRRSINIISEKENCNKLSRVRLNESKMKRNVKESNMSNNDVRSKVNRPKSILKSLQPNKENDDTSFVSGENFDFSKPIGTPYLQSPVAGPMTRARKLRRTSVYARPTAESKLSQLNNESNQSTLDHISITPAKSNPDTHHKKNIKSVNINQNDTIEMKINSTRSVKTNNSININPKLNLKDSSSNHKMDMSVVTPILAKRRPALSVISQHIESLDNINKVAPCTPQPPSDPTVVLKKKMKLKMEAEIKDKVSLMPPSSPYALICDADEDGSLNECFEKIEERPSRSKAGTFVTATPFPSRNKRKNINESGNIGIMKQKSSSKPEKDSYAKAQQKDVYSDFTSNTPKSYRVNAKRHKIGDTLKQQMTEKQEKDEISDTKRLNPDGANLESQSPSQFPQSHLITGDLVRACIIM